MNANPIAAKLTQLRRLMEEHGIDFYYVPSRDEHNNEYVPPRWERRAWISDFTGSAGDALIGKDNAYLWTDPRYFLQAQHELDPAHYKLQPMGQGSTPAVDRWLQNQGAGCVCGVDPKVISIAQASHIHHALTANGGKLQAIDYNLIDALWSDQPAAPEQPLHLHDVAFSGVAAEQKIAHCRSTLRDLGVGAHVVTMLDAIAWLFNIRGSDIAYNPLVISYAIITPKQATLFIEPNKLSAADRDQLTRQGITIQPYDAFQAALHALEDKTLLDPNTASWWVQQQLDHAALVLQASPITLNKAIKNNTEQDGMRTAHRIDALAEVTFLHWLENYWQQGVTEIQAAQKIDELRLQDPRCVDLSFNTISGFAGNGAIVHYRVEHDSAARIDDSSLYLVDSGGQYHCGTTDITRTIHLGTPTAQQKRHYTLVLKGHLALRHAIFPAGTCGEHLNALAHLPLWQQGLDFGHGTGHGVGCYLCVHEGPHAISSRPTNVPLQPGMVVSNEPGVYLENEYGIRIENLCLVKEMRATEDSVTNSGPFYGFEDLTLVPYCRKLIAIEQLSTQEIAWINEYHQQVYTTLVDALTNSAVRDWLKEATQPL